jgi:hypothetical protein
MKPLFLLLLGLCLVAGASAAAPSADGYKPSTKEVRQKVVEVIGLQLSAFRASDPQKAYSFAARRFREQFPLGKFEEMVKGAYPEIWDNTKAEFGVVRDDGASAVVSVEITDKANDWISYDYFLLKEDLFWRIAGVIRHEPSKPPQA